ncbi:MAG: tRNA pseudouridine(13) synthase TruD, partial [Campylobacteraceae bacterium]|nr:tRNA pseudouridine(13) synthase TruD [Campylobacteraceae bacterium]
FQGDVLHHYPAGKAFVCEDIQTELARFEEEAITATGWLPGNRSMRCNEGIAKVLEEKIYSQAEPYLAQMDGARRFAWAFLRDVECEYKEDQSWFEMHFSLPKGSYATVILEELTHQL